MGYLPYHISYNVCKIHKNQYGGFLVLVFLLEIVLTASIYAYRERLTHGFERGLNVSLQNYGLDVIKSADFDVMQAKVSELINLYVLLDINCFNFNMHVQLECCGSHGFQDWDTLNPPQPVPRSCCLQLTNCDVENPDDIYNIVRNNSPTAKEIKQQAIDCLFIGLL